MPADPVYWNRFLGNNNKIKAARDIGIVSIAAGDYSDAKVCVILGLNGMLTSLPPPDSLGDAMLFFIRRLRRN